MSAGHLCVVIPVEHLEEYMAALGLASAEGNVEILGRSL